MVFPLKGHLPPGESNHCYFAAYWEGQNASPREEKEDTGQEEKNQFWVQFWLVLTHGSSRSPVEMAPAPSSNSYPLPGQGVAFLDDATRFL